jgi:hypothetical protein
MRRVFKNNLIFDGDEEFFKAEIAKAEVYLEFGVGGTSLIVDKIDGIKQVTSVDTSQKWIEKIQDLVTNSEKFDFHFIDLGPLKEWGTPTSYDCRNSFLNYIDFVNLNQIVPDLILIDGRFRVATFLSCLLNSTEGTKIIFDDYVERKNYHIVESIIPPDKVSSRQAIFTVRRLNKTTIKEARRLIEKFEFVMD